MKKKKYVYRLLLSNLVCIGVGMLLRNFLTFENCVILFFGFLIYWYIPWEENAYKIASKKKKEAWRNGSNELERY